MPLSNTYGDRLDDLVDSSDKQVIIWLVRNTKGPRAQPTQSKDGVAGNSELEEEEGLEEMIEDGMDVSIFTWRS